MTKFRTLFRCYRLSPCLREVGLGFSVMRHDETQRVNYMRARLSLFVIVIQLCVFR